MWIKTYKALEQAGIKTKLANPFKTRVIAEARIKTDKLDASTHIGKNTVQYLLQIQDVDTRVKYCCTSIA